MNSSTTEDRWEAHTRRTSVSSVASDAHADSTLALPAGTCGARKTETTSLTVLVPHYNDPAGLELSLQSVKSQTWLGSLEVIICDDGSSDEAYANVEELVDKLKISATVVRNRANRGRPYTRNVLLDAAHGTYSAWLDAGDEWYPNKIEQQLQGIHRARLKGVDYPVWITCNYDWQWAGAKPKPRRQDVASDQVEKMLLGTLSAYLWTVLAPTEAFRSVGYFDLRLTRLQDLDFFLRFAERGGRLVLPPSEESLCVYHKSDVGRSGDEILACFKWLFAKHSPALLARSRRFRRNRLQHVYLHAARFTNNNGNRMKTLRYLTASALTNPVRFGRIMHKNGWKL